MSFAVSNRDDFADAVEVADLEVGHFRNPQTTVRQELATRHEDADRLRRQHVERARYEADLAQRRFLKVDPDNRLVADSLEADWNGKLRALAAAQEAYEKPKAGRFDKR